MAKRYTFFRDPTGRAYKKDDDKHAPKKLLAMLGESSVLNSEGHVGWTGSFAMEFHDAIASSFIVLGDQDVELNDSDTDAIVWMALGDVSKRFLGKALSPREVLRSADRFAATFFRQTPTEYLLVTSLSVDTFPAGGIVVLGCRISPLKSRLPGFPLPNVLSSRGHRGAFDEHLAKTKYQTVKIETRGRSIHEAVERGFGALNVMRALWSVAATYGHWSIHFNSPGRRPIGVIHTGPVHTLHHPDGSAANDDY